MARYEISFHGRRVGALGISYDKTEIVEAETPEQATLLLYDRYEHISGLRVSKQKTGAQSLFEPPSWTDDEERMAVSVKCPLCLASSGQDCREGPAHIARIEAWQRLQVRS